MTRRTHGCSFALLLGAGLLLTLLDPIELQADAVPSSTASGGVSSTSGRPVKVKVRDITYASIRPVEDDEKWVEGGAEGSSILLIRTRNSSKSRWVFLHGKHMFLRLTGDPSSSEVITTTPGEFIKSQAADWHKSTTTEYNKRKLTNHLQLLYHARGILHVPFLKGKGWQNGVGATWSETEPILKGMNLNYKIMSSNNAGRVINQTPVGGMPVLTGETVMLWFDGKNQVLAGLEGNTHTTAIGVVDHGNDCQETVSGEITREYTDTVASPSCNPGGKDIFWKLPGSAQGRRMTTTLVSMGPRVTLSAWELDPVRGRLVPVSCRGKADCCAFGRGPKIEFDVHPTRATFVTVDVAPRYVEQRAEWFTVDLEWTPPNGRQEGEQDQPQAQQKGE